MIAVFVGLMFCAISASFGISVAEQGGGPFGVTLAAGLPAIVPVFILLCAVLDRAGKRTHIANIVFFAMLTAGGLTALILSILSPRPDQYFGFMVGGLLLFFPVFLALGFLLEYIFSRSRPDINRT